MRRLLAACAVGIAVGTMAPVASGVSGCAAALPRRDGWSAFAAPPFATGPRALSGYAVSATDTRTQYVTNGSAVLRSDDSACTWREVLAASDPAGGAAIVQLGVAGRVTYAVVEHRALGPGVPPAQVEVQLSHDGGATWGRADTGLPPGARALRVTFAADTMHGYALLRMPAAPLGDGGTPTTLLYVTADGGTSWTPSPAQVTYDDLAAGATPAEVWAWGATGLGHSADAGATFTAVPAVGRPVTAVAMPTTASAGATPAVFTPGAMWTSTGGGWSRQRLGKVEVTAAAYDSARRLAVGSTSDGGVWVVRVGGSVTRVAPTGDERVQGLVLSRTAIPEQVWGYTHASVFRGGLTPALGVYVPAPPPPLPPVPPVELRPGDGPLPTVPTLRPARLNLALPAGASRTVRYTLDLPPTPTPVDVDFLIDTTNSIAPIIDSLRVQLADIVNRMEALHLDAQFGVGAFRDYPLSQYAPPDSDNYAYKLIRRIGPVDTSLEDALYALRTGGGTLDGRTSALAAEYQAATGAGQTVTSTTDPTYVIPAGLDAGFRPGAVRVVLVVSDTEPRDRETGYPGPAIAQVGDALSARHVYQTGLVVGAPPDGVPGPRKIFEDVALRTGAVASGHGVDCDGDGQVDIEPGAPLVCDLAGDGLPDAITGIVEGIRDLADVGLSVSGDARVVAAVSQTTYGGVDVKSYNRLGFDVRYSCPPGVAGGAAQLAASVAGVRVVGATARVTCVPPAPPAVRTIVVPRAVAVLVPPPPPPPAVNQVPNPNPNPNPQPNVNVQAGAAAQEQERAQLAYAEQEERPGEDLAMSALWGLCAALTTAGACGYAMRTRTAARTAVRTSRAG